MNPENLPAGRELNLPHTFLPHPFLGGGFSIPPIDTPSGINTALPLESNFQVINEKMPSTRRAMQQSLPRTTSTTRNGRRGAR